MKPEIIHDADDLRFYAKIGAEEAELTYTYPEEGVMDFDHTYVPDEARGQGIASQLVKAGLDFAKAQGNKVIPSCPVVEAYTKRHPEYNTIVI
jgi:predicted GNAT family acetyltransferase